MKLTCLLITLALVQVSAETYSQTKKLTLNLKDAPLAVLFEEIEKTSEFNFFYDSSGLDLSQKVTVTVEDSNIETVLDMLFTDSDISYEIFDRYIIIKSKESGIDGERFLAQQQQQRSVSGKVTDSGGQPLPGVTVVVKGTTQGTVTNADGEYSLTNITGDATLQFSFVGMQTQEVVVGDQTRIDVTMEEDVIGIEEVVAIGYGTQKKKDVTGSISTISTEELKSIPAFNVGQLMQGQASGVQITSGSGAPGQGLQVIIRGNNNFSTNPPLYVVDGIPLIENNIYANIGDAGFNRYTSLNSINPQDIESIEILKDASATAIYGTRASGGVVMITTKRGKAGDPKFSFDSNVGFQQPIKKLDVLNTKQYAEYINSRIANSGGLEPPIPHLDPPPDVDTDWQNEIFRKNVPVQNYRMAITGGTGLVQYNISGGFNDEKGTLLNTRNKRYSFHSNIDARLSERVKIGTSLNISYINNHAARFGDQYSTIGWAVKQLPIIPVRNEDGSWGGPTVNAERTWGDAGNPVAQLTEEKHELGQTEILGNVYGEVMIIEGLTFRSSLSMDLFNDKARQYVPLYWSVDIPSTSESEQGRLMSSFSKSNNLIFDNYLTFSKLFGDHNISIMVGSSAEKYNANNIVGVMDGSRYPSKPDITDPSSERRYVATGTNERALLSFFARATYDYMGKYLFTGTVRRDGSYIFGPNNRFGTFPSASLGWVVSNENFMQDNDWISFLKLRGSWGRSGNQNISPWQFLSTLRSAQYSFGTPQNLYTGYGPDQIINPDIHWEETRQTDIGIDLTLFNRITLNMDYYSKLTDDLLLTAPVPPSTGYLTGGDKNMAMVSNKGLEISLGTNNLTGILKWDSRFNISSVYNFVVHILFIF